MRTSSTVLVAPALVAALVGTAVLGRAPAEAAAPTDQVRAVQETTPESCPQQPSYLGLDAYRHFDELSYLDLASRTSSATTADLAGSNNDSVHGLGALPDGGRVLLDEANPTLLTYLRMQQAHGAPWTLTADHQPGTTFAETDFGQARAATPAAATMPYPLSLNRAQTPGNTVRSAPTWGRDGLSWSASAGLGNSYALLRKLPYGAPVPAPDAAGTAAVAAELLRAGSDISPPGLPTVSGTASVAPGQESTLATLTGGPLQLRALQIRVPYGQKVRTGNARLRIYWDGESTPSVDAPLKFLAGDGAGVYQPAGRPLVAAYPAGITSDGSSWLQYDLYWPMPFHRQARIAVVDTSSSPLTGLTWRAAYEPFPDPACWWGTFHANYTDVPHPVAGRDMRFLDVRGSGRVVGTVVNFDTVGVTLEGDPHFSLDGSRTPQVQATGTEEWGMGGDYWNYFSGHGRQVTLPLGGMPSARDNPAGADVDGAALYRFLIADSITYGSRAVLDWEHGPTDDTTTPYRASVLWYGVPEPTEHTSDVLSVGDPGSRAAHAYVSPTDAAYSLTAGYGYSVQTPPVVLRGAASTGASSFDVAVDPANVGVFLRRTLDYGTADQRAEVSVDGQPAGTWYTAGASSAVDTAQLARRWRDDEFLLPPALTAGRSTVRVTITPVPSRSGAGLWTAFAYEAHSTTAAPAPLAPFDALVAHHELLGGAAGLLGRPVGPEVAVGAGLVQSYDRGVTCWSPAAGAWSVHGAVLERFRALGGPTGVLRFPLSDETAVGDGSGRYNRFAVGGAVYWSPATGAQAVYGAIYARWTALSGVRGRLGYPTASEYAVAGGRRSDFVGGSLSWSSTSGTVTLALRP